MIKEYYPYIENDMYDIIGYIPVGLLAGIMIGAIIFLMYRLKTGKWNWAKGILYCLFITYVVTVIQIVYLSRFPGSRTDIALGLGDTWGTTIQAHAYVIENILMFVPFGILFPMLGRAAMYRCIPVAVGASLLIEGTQYITGRGYCQLDDVITNAAGACIGYIIILFIGKRCPFVGKVLGESRSE